MSAKLRKGEKVVTETVEFRRLGYGPNGGLCVLDVIKTQRTTVLTQPKRTRNSAVQVAVRKQGTNQGYRHGILTVLG